MTNNQLIKKLVRTLRTDGIVATSRDVASHFRTRIADALEGKPGYYAVHRHRLGRHYDDAALTPVWISPAEITQLTGGYERRERGHLDYVPFFKPREASWDHLPYTKELPYYTTVAGNWDKQTADFSQLLMYRGARQRFRKGRTWEETVYYQKLHEQLRSDGWSQSEADTLARERCDELEAIHETVRQEGYRSQQELNGHPLHEVTVNISRDGELLYNCEGRHRLSVAKILGVKKIPVLVLAVHDDYQGSLEEAVQ